MNLFGGVLEFIIGYKSSACAIFIRRIFGGQKFGGG